MSLDQAEQTAGVIRAVDHKLRYGILKMLSKSGKSLSVGQISTKMKLTQAVTSQHLAIMKDAGILSSQRDGRTVFYSLNEKFFNILSRLVTRILSNQQAALENNVVIVERDESDPDVARKVDTRRRYKEWENSKRIKLIIADMLGSLPADQVNKKDPKRETKRIVKLIKNNIGLTYEMNEKDIERCVHAVLTGDKREINALKNKFAPHVYTTFKQPAASSVRKNMTGILKEQNDNLSEEEVKQASGKILKTVKGLREKQTA